MDTISALIVIAAVFVGWSIGANSASNVVSTLVGPNITSYRTAAALVAVLMIAGAFLQSGPVINTISNGILPQKDLEKDKLIALSALLATVIFIAVVTSLALPVSSSHAIVGGLAGSVFAIGVMKDFNQTMLRDIVISWFLTPILSVLVAYVLYKAFLVPLSKRVSLMVYGQSFRILAVIATAFVAYGLGANNIGNPVGLVLGSGTVTDRTLVLLLVIGSMCFGIMSFGKKVVNNVSRNITFIDPLTAFTAQFSAGLVIYFYTIVGMPISTTQAILGGLVGVGISKGAGMVNRSLAAEIFVGGIITPISTAIMSMVIYGVLSMAVVSMHV